MSNISADKIKSLRDKTGAGIMDCKNALVENNGEVESAIDWLRKKGIAKANKKSSRVGQVTIATFILKKASMNIYEGFLPKRDLLHCLWYTQRG